MFKKKKKKEVPEAPEVPQEQPDTPIIETKVEQPSKTGGEEDIAYYQKTYSPINFNTANSDNVICGLLFGILTETRKLREAIEKRK